MLLKDRVAIVTGGSQGIGLAICRTLAEQGALVVVADVNEKAAQDVVLQLGPDRALAFRADVTSESDVESLVAIARERFGKVDIYVNNAGFTRDATLRKMPLSDFQSVVDVHLKGTWLGTRAAAASMRETGGGTIINVSSISGKVGNAGQTNYSAAKAGIIGLTKAAAKELGWAGIRVNAIQPGIIETAMTAVLSEEIRAARLADIPLGRFGEVQEVANVVLFLASDLSSYLTGITIEIAGGRNI